MKRIEWKEEYKTKVKLIDDQHFNFVMKLNALLENNYPIEKENFSAIIQNILRDIDIHFETENNLMKENKFEGYFSHKAEHDRFRKSFLTKIKYIEPIDILKIEELVASTFNWFVNHLEINDRKLAKYLNSININ